MSLLSAALVFGLTMTYDLEIPGERQLSGPEWQAVQHTLYGGFAVVGGLAEILGLLSSGILAYLRCAAGLLHPGVRGDALLRGHARRARRGQ